MQHVDELALSTASSDNVIGILAVCDSISYCMMMNAITRAGFVPFAISPRNSAKGLAHLLRITKTTYVYASQDNTMQVLVSSANEILKSEGGASLPLLGMPSFDQFQDDFQSPSLLPPMVRPDEKSTAVILHSSGSTSELSKPIPLSHKTYLQWALLPCYGERDLCGEIMACQSVPILPTPAVALASAKASKSTLLFCVPAFLEIWSSTPEGMDMLKAMKAVVSAGAPLSRDIGNKLIKERVMLTQFYGAIETGCLSLYLPLESYGKDWEYFIFSKHCKPVLKLRNDMGSNLYELILVDIPSHTPCFINMEVEGKSAYLLNDLLEPHPERSNFWRVYGRTDDQITLSNGLNINPVPTETHIAKHPDIAFAIMFGKAHTHPGLLVQLRKDLIFDPLNKEGLDSIRERIWPTVEQANTTVQKHTTIIKEMIIVASPEKPFDLTGKMQPRRHVVLKSYESEIAYKDVENYSVLQASV
ncbi:hypothetical protein M422DRAFT_252798 [Sphaerobolus stellatus SS14]|uniref:AMP-dependent synthetase/ligase domain-containing protein n=1 Tax=Sphaerobolus stellatus (strain SS14) TaxID=990650 RepID=A0A0C9VA99_SPHS4|nr:hypothetical protein M422DRAFT_252798 [Sphaerobolus stellatus SS14]